MSTHHEIVLELTCENVNDIPVDVGHTPYAKYDDPIESYQDLGDAIETLRSKAVRDGWTFEGDRCWCPGCSEYADDLVG